MFNEIIKLKEKCYNCKECPLGRRTVSGLDPHVFGSGNITSKIVVVAEAPGYDETVKKRPLAGRSGVFYDEKILKVANLIRKNVYTTNSILCRPNEKNRNPLFSELDACFPLLDAQISLIKPNLIVTLGNIPLYSVCDIAPSGITKLHGIIRFSRKWSDNIIRTVFPMFHPAYCLRGSGLKEMEADARALGFLTHSFIKSSSKLAEFCDVKISEVMNNYGF